jgi:hypothetical protein
VNPFLSGATAHPHPFCALPLAVLSPL